MSFSNLCDFTDDINNLKSTLNYTVSRIQEVGVEILDRLNEIIVDNGEEFINNTKPALLEMLSVAENTTKQNALDIIDKLFDNLSNTAGSLIEHLKNATTDVLDESLGKIRNAADTFVQDIVTSQFFIIVSIFILIALFSATGCLLRRLVDGSHCCKQLFEILSNMILIITSLLTILWFGLALVWFFEKAIDEKDPFYIVVTIILLFAILYGLCHLGWVLKTKIPEGWEWLHQKISTRRGKG